jgi:hypothetical protein
MRFTYKENKSIHLGCVFIIRTSEVEKDELEMTLYKKPR